MTVEKVVYVIKDSLHWGTVGSVYDDLAPPILPNCASLSLVTLGRHRLPGDKGGGYPHSMRSTVAL